MVKNITTILLTICLVLGLLWISILDEIYYYKTTKYVLYTIQIELLNGSIDTIKTRQPKGIHFQINCSSYKGNFKDCRLEAIPKKGELYNFLGGHWYRIMDGVINFKIIKNENKKI